MKISRILLFVFGGLGLLIIGCLIGISLPIGSWGWQAMPMMGWDSHMVGGFAPRLFLGLRWLIMPLFWLGPIAGIVALIVVLTRRNTPPPPPPPTPPAAAE